VPARVSAALSRSVDPGRGVAPPAPPVRARRPASVRDCPFMAAARGVVRTVGVRGFAIGRRRPAERYGWRDAACTGRAGWPAGGRAGRRCGRPQSPVRCIAGRARPSCSDIRRGLRRAGARDPTGRVARGVEIGHQLGPIHQTCCPSGLVGECFTQQVLGQLSGNVIFNIVGHLTLRRSVGNGGAASTTRTTPPVRAHRLFRLAH
jgi:hypothetical protein